MTFNEANELITNPNDTEAIKAFGCRYFHNICIKCKNKSLCYRKEPLIKECNFYVEASE